MHAPGLLRSVFDAAPSGMALLSLDGEWLDVNRTMCEALGYAPEELIGDSLETFVHPADLRGGELRARLLAGEARVVHGERRFVRRDGRVVWMRVSMSLERDEDDEPLHFVTQWDDITETKAAEARLRLLATIVEQSDDAIIVYSREGRITEWNSGAVRLYGYEEWEVLGRGIDVIVPDDLLGEGERLIEEVLDGRPVRHLTTRRRRRDGRTVHVSLTVAPILGADGVPLAFSSVARDITEQLQAQERLIDSERQMDEAQALANVGSWHWDLSSDRPIWSAELGRIYGYPEAHRPTAADLTARVHAEDREMVSRLIGAARQGVPNELEYRVIRPDGTLRHVHARHQTRTDARGRVTHLYGAVQDITARKHYEAELERLATHDSLTGLPNRRSFEAELAGELARSRRDGSWVSLVLLDVDHFKRINDTFGHPMGDAVLQRAGQVLAGQVRSHEMIARVGGEEFAWILPAADPDGALVAAERIRAAIAATVFGDAGQITVSIGICSARGNVDAELLYRRADCALLAAKRSGRNRIVADRGEWALDAEVA